MGLEFHVHKVFSIILILRYMVKKERTELRIGQGSTFIFSFTFETSSPPLVATIEANNSDILWQPKPL